MWFSCSFDMFILDSFSLAGINSGTMYYLICNWIPGVIKVCILIIQFFGFGENAVTMCACDFSLGKRVEFCILIRIQH
jgi:hypothetical protein